MCAVAAVCLDAFWLCVQCVDFVWAGYDNYYCVAGDVIAVIVIPYFLFHFGLLLSLLFYRKLTYLLVVGALLVFTIASSIGLIKATLERRHDWFVKRGIQQYSRCVDDIRKNRSWIHEHGDDNDLITFKRTVRGDIFASTNADGSLFVFFMTGRGMDQDFGYVYYDGTNIVVRSDGRVALNGNWGACRPISGPWYQF